jgi:hypothetical protein
VNSKLLDVSKGIENFMTFDENGFAFVDLQLFFHLERSSPVLLIT